MESKTENQGLCSDFQWATETVDSDQYISKYLLLWNSLLLHSHTSFTLFVTHAALLHSCFSQFSFCKISERINELHPI